MKIVEALPGRKPATRELVAEVEQRLQVVLPLDYVAFLLAFNGGRPRPNGFEFEEAGRHSDSAVHLFYGIFTDPRFDLEHKASLFRNRIPNELIAIGCDPFGNQILLRAAAPRHGSVWFWDHEAECAVESSRLHFVASSFGDLVKLLDSSGL